jgi:DNA-binding GntR family transcriptional regulator
MSTIISNQVYNFIRERLFSGTLRPGDRISEFGIAKELNISRSPIREAISQLTSDGLVEKYPGFGTFVRVPDRRQIEELFVLREMLECYAVRQAAQHAGRQQIDALRGYCDDIRLAAKAIQRQGTADEQVTRQIIDADLAFHMLIMDIAGNRQILRIIENCRILTSIFNLYSSTQLGLKEAAHIWRQHRAIQRALENRDAESADCWIKKQIQLSRNMALASLDALGQSKPAFVSALTIARQ